MSEKNVSFIYKAKYPSFKTHSLLHVKIDYAVQNILCTNILILERKKRGAKQES